MLLGIVVLNVFESTILRLYLVFGDICEEIFSQEALVEICKFF